MNLQHSHILPAILLTLPAIAPAQELNESMTVQGAYDPVIRRHERLSQPLTRPAQELPAANLPLAEGSVVTDVAPLISPLTATEWQSQLPEPQRGYFDLIAGSYLNTSLSAGYEVLHARTTSLELHLQHNSTSLFRADKISPYRRRYDERLGAQFSHTFTPGILSACADYHLGYFNYYHTLNPRALQSSQTSPGTQTINELRVAAAWQSTLPEQGLSYSAEALVHYFGYRRLYEWQDETLAPMQAPRETDMSLRARLAYALNSASTFSLNLSGRLLAYSRSVMPTPGFYSITPAYVYSGAGVRLKLGARLDLTSSISGTTRFSSFHAAPDVSFSYASGHFSASLSATGGVTPLTLASRHELYYYSLPYVASTTPIYTPVDARLQLGLSGLNGVDVRIFAAYAISRDTPLEGTYPLYLFHNSPAPADYLLTPASTDVRGVSFGVGTGYRLSSLLSVDASLTYTPQHGSRGSFNGIDRPRWILTSLAKVSPIKGLDISLGYDYRGVRNLYYRPEPHSPLTALRLPDLYNLHAEAAYTFASRYTLGILVDNILSANAWYSPQMPLEGFTLSGRFSVVF